MFVSRWKGKTRKMMIPSPVVSYESLVSVKKKNQQKQKKQQERKKEKNKDRTQT